MAVVIRGSRCKNGCVYFVENDFITRTPKHQHEWK